MPKLLLLIVATMSLATFAQKKPEPRQPEQKIIFGEEDLIEGKLNRPDGEFFTGHGGVKHAILLKIREDFKDKVMESASAL